MPPTYSTSSFPALSEIDLADKFASTRAPIDVLIGADYLAALMEGPYMHSPDHTLLAQRTIFGWIVAGVVLKTGPSHSVTVHHCFEVEKTLRDFWELEEVPEEYLVLGHMSPVPMNSDFRVFLPHHGDITRILMNCRAFRYVGVTDIVIMFSQILVRLEDRKYQNILWKTDSGELQAFELNTVTYGTGPAPFLSSRVLRESASTDGSNFPLAHDVLLNSTYVDDILFGAHDLKQLSSVRDQLIALLAKGGFSLKNAKIYDPLGWISPIVITLKQLMQSTWLLKLSWDEEIPEPVQSKWLKCYEQLRDLQSLRIPRWTGQTPNIGERELIGFCDASELAYGAVVYERLTDENGHLSVHLVMSKTKVAPIKTTLIPRLELVAAALLVKLLVHVKGSLVGNCDAIRYYSDSQVALAWIAKQPVHWKTFVASRVSYIQTHLPEASWHHVPTKLNPADLCSRGTSAQQLSEDSLWWHGPAFLRELTVNPVQVFETTEESRKVALTAQLDTNQCWFFDKFSSWSKLVRVMAYVPRFVQRTRKTGQWEDSLLSASEIRSSIEALVKVVQRTHFASELSALNLGLRIPSRSKVLSLYPIMDSQEILRIGGRLRNAEISELTKHTIILPDCHLTAILIRQTHLDTFHGGIQLTLSTLRQRFCVVNARNLVKSCVHKCTTFVRERAKLGSQLKGSLPAARVSRSFTFEHTGVDYAGPFLVKLHHGRNAKSLKCYVAVFVCLSTRALHLELVSRFDTEAFLAALSRFISRRGKPAVMYSDNGLNFQGADAELKRTYQCSLEAARAENTDSLSEIEWKFIPVATPHWGGLWESAVKSMKHHLKRSLGVFAPNFEEMTTLLTKIEACLNSRPISRLHDDPESLDVLTPGQFLSGRALNSLPKFSTLDLRESSLNRWQTVTRITETFWKKWSSEYLHTLQHRPKWQNSNSEFWSVFTLFTGILKFFRLPSFLLKLPRTLHRLLNFSFLAPWDSSATLIMADYPSAHLLGVGYEDEGDDVLELHALREESEFWRLFGHILPEGQKETPAPPPPPTPAPRPQARRQRPVIASKKSIASANWAGKVLDDPSARELSAMLKKSESGHSGKR
ncbi:uncharacterized protein [Prorops nasuta]|uniref:uncharacterized protein n=1 Tax=Prorops nasuta TaxID=863751 RepID=UPI0034CF8F7B